MSEKWLPGGDILPLLENNEWKIVPFIVIWVVFGILVTVRYQIPRALSLIPNLSSGLYFRQALRPLTPSPSALREAIPYSRRSGQHYRP